MDKARKREIARAYAERTRVEGVFAVRCTATGAIWVSSSRNLDTQKNSVWFAFGTGGHPNKAAQAAWKAHGAEAFSYEIVEELSSEALTPTGFRDLLKRASAVGATPWAPARW